MFGHYEPLLDIRRMVLDTVGYSAEIATNASQLRGRLESATHKYSLFLICHTTTPIEESQLRALAAQAELPVYHIEKLLDPEQFISDVSYLVARSAPAAGATSRL